VEIKRSVAGILAASLLLAALPGLAVAQDDTAATPALEGVEWDLAMLQDASLPDGVGVTLFLSGGDVVGNAGCNSYFGSYVLDGDSLTFPQPFGTTRMLCDDAVMAVEDAYLPLLQATTSWSIDEAGALQLAGSDGAAALRYGEASVDVTATDVAALTEVLDSLQTQIDSATAEVGALAKKAAGLNVNRLDRRLTSVEQGVAKTNRSVDVTHKGLTDVRQKANADAKAIAAAQDKIAGLDEAVQKLRTRVANLEQTNRALEERLAALEAGQ